MSLACGYQNLIPGFLEGRLFAYGQGGTPEAQIRRVSPSEASIGLRTAPTSNVRVIYLISKLGIRLW